MSIPRAHRPFGGETDTLYNRSRGETAVVLSKMEDGGRPAVARLLPL